MVALFVEVLVVVGVRVKVEVTNGVTVPVVVMVEVAVGVDVFATVLVEVFVAVEVFVTLFVAVFVTVFVAVLVLPATVLVMVGVAVQEGRGSITQCFLIARKVEVHGGEVYGVH